MEEMKEALRLKTKLDAIRPIDKEQEDRIMQKFRLDWNYHSNHLEGNTLTYGETKALILFGITAQGKPLKDTLEITGHNEAINWVMEMVKGERPLTENFIRELHSLLLKDSYKESKNGNGELVPRKISSGKYKTTTNHVQTVTGEIFYFATPEETPAKMFDLLNWYKEKSDENDRNPLLIAAEFHYKFIRIHPFDDGNGRTARILMNFILMKFGFPPVIIKTEDKANYFAALQLADAGNIEAFITYITHNLVHSLEIMIAGANGESIEEDDDLDKEIALLEHKLKGYGDKLDKVKSLENLNDIYVNTIMKFANEINEKLEPLKMHYLNSGIFFNTHHKSSELSKAIPYVEGENLPNMIRVYIILNSMKIKGLENHNFSHEIEFEFNELNYTVTESKSKKNILFTKNYSNLTDHERKELVKHVIKIHNVELDEILNNTNQ
jgi:Fic family protein